MKRGLYYFTRKIHRYLGVFLGIQFMLWTAGGLYFSWTDIKEIRGDHLRKQPKLMNMPKGVVSPETALSKMDVAENGSDLRNLELIEVLGKQYYSITLRDKKSKSDSVHLVDALTGNPRPHFSQTEAVKIASEGLLASSQVMDVEFLTEGKVSSHHEYREKPLPAFAITFENPSGLTVYVSAAKGNIESLRTNEWRAFDFLWMLHTMDFYGRDDINNNVLRWVSVFGVLMLISGFVLFVITSPMFLRMRSKKSPINPNE